MSALAWLFGLGAAAVVFPLLFHLIRRTPQGRTEFSSLMFLKSSPPTLTRRSRLDNLWLLLLRILAICLLAFAFMRPFFRGNSELAQFDVEHRRVAILLDVSASMRREGVWDRAQRQVVETLDQLEAKDHVALFTFDRNVSAIVPFENDPDPSVGNVPTVSAIKEKLAELDPGWSHSDMGTAMVTLANQLDDWQDTTRSDETGRRPKLQMYVVSDMQAGSATESLQSYQWPDLVKTQFINVAPLANDNATVELLSQSRPQREPTLRVRVANQNRSSSEAFQVTWQQNWHTGRVKTTTEVDEELAFVVAAGESRVLELPLEKAINANAFLLDGDGESFDNAYFVTPATPQTMTLIYVGDDDVDDADSAMFYLARLFPKSTTRSYRVYQIKSDQLNDIDDAKRLIDASTLVSVDGQRVEENTGSDSATTKPLIVLGAALIESQNTSLQSIVASGVTLLAIANEQEMINKNSELIGATVDETNQAVVDEYAIVGEMELTDPLFRPFLDPMFSDFTDTKFWKHQRVQLDDTSELLASFDDRTPAIWRHPVGSGNVIAMSSSWRPKDSQWFLDPKFLAFFLNLFERSASVPKVQPSALVGDRLKFAPSDEERIMMRPNGSVCIVEAGDSSYAKANQPGIYRLMPTAAESLIESLEDLSSNSAVKEELLNKTTSFAVNVDRRESNADPLAVDQLERLGVEVGLHTTAASELAQLRELKDRELENQQKIWKWLIVAAIVLLIFETYYAGRKANQSVVDLAAEPTT
ncbi:MAG: BatA domain-containing protein [Planctomycetota bacterium]